MRNINLSKARKTKNDEFYTFYEDIQKEKERLKQYQNLEMLEKSDTYTPILKNIFQKTMSL